MPPSPTKSTPPKRPTHPFVDRLMKSLHKKGSAYELDAGTWKQVCDEAKALREGAALYAALEQLLAFAAFMREKKGSPAVGDAILADLEELSRRLVELARSEGDASGEQAAQMTKRLAAERSALGKRGPTLAPPAASGFGVGIRKKR